MDINDSTPSPTFCLLVSHSTKLNLGVNTPPLCPSRPVGIQHSTVTPDLFFGIPGHSYDIDTRFHSCSCHTQGSKSKPLKVRPLLWSLTFVCESLSLKSAVVTVIGNRIFRSPSTVNLLCSIHNFIPEQTQKFPGLYSF